MNDSDVHLLDPLASCAGGDLYDDIFSTRNHTSQRDWMGLVALPANGRSIGEPEGYSSPLCKGTPTPLLGAVKVLNLKGYVAGSEML